MVVDKSLPDLLVIEPPVPLPPNEVLPPSPFTVSPPLAPVLSKIIPVADPPFEEILWKSKLLAPIVVFVTFKAVAVVVVIVLPEFVELMVPPPVAVKAAFVEVLNVKRPVKLIVAPVFVARLIPVLVPEEVIAPLNVIVPPVADAILIALWEAVA